MHIKDRLSFFFAFVFFQSITFSCLSPVPVTFYKNIRDSSEEKNKVYFLSEDDLQAQKRQQGCAKNADCSQAFWSSLGSPGGDRRRQEQRNLSLISNTKTCRDEHLTRSNSLSCLLSVPLSLFHSLPSTDMQLMAIYSCIFFLRTCKE